jgi:hypothetical protein
MVQLRIPKGHESSLMKIRDLDEKSFSGFLSALEGVMPILHPEVLVDTVSSEVEAIPERDIHRIIVTLVSLYHFSIHENLPPEDLVESICQAMEASENEQLSLSSTLSH